LREQVERRRELMEVLETVSQGFPHPRLWGGLSRKRDRRTAFIPVSGEADGIHYRKREKRTLIRRNEAGRFR
jgi:hypothetical protein